MRADVPSVDDVKAAKGHEQLVLLNQYMSSQAFVDARTALSLAESLKSNLPLNQFPQEKLYLHLWQGVALNFIGNRRDALILLDTVINESTSAGLSDVTVEALLQRATIYEEQSNSDLALTDRFNVLSMIEHKGNYKLLADTQSAIGMTYFSQAKFTHAFEWLLNAKENYQAIDLERGVVHTLGRIGSIYRSIGDLDNALSYQLQTIEGQRKVGNKKSLAIAFNNTAIVYKDLGKYQEAIEMHTKSLELKREIGYERGMVYSFNNLGETHRLAGDLATAKSYLAKAEELANKLNNRMLLGSTNLYLGRIAITEKRYEDAERILAMAMGTYRKRNSASRIAEGLVEQANLSMQTQHYQTAVSQLKEAIEYAQKAQKNVVLFKAYELLSEVYANIGDFRSAYDMQVTFRQSKDKLFDLNSQQRVEMLVVQNQIEETKRNLEFVKQQAKLTESELNNKIGKRNLLMLAVVSFLLLLWYLYSQRVNKRELKLVKQSQAEITEKEQKLSLALWASGDVLWSWDLKAQTVSRENADDLSALPDGKVDPTWQNLKAHVHQDDFHRLTSHLESIKNQQEEAFEVAYRVKNKAEEWAWVQDKGKVVEYDPEDRPIKVAGIQHDITILKQQEADLVVLNTELEKRVQQRTKDLVVALNDLKATQQSLVEAEKMAALGSLVAGLAHELNTPLGTAMMAVTHLHAELQQIEAKIEQNKLTKIELTEGLKVLAHSGDLIFSGVNRTSALVEQFKRVSVSEREEGRVSESFSILTNAAYKSALHAAGTPEHVELLSIPTGNIITYSDSFMQVLELLISNAINHAEPNGKLKISVFFKEHDNFYEVLVEDNGIGVPENELTKIFNPFYTLARHRGHVGLGLNIVFNLVSQVLGGEISCERSELGGAKFRFTVEKIHEELLL
ncbi:tetratricopeptide repeat protein [Pseudoalteromonas phenolica]|uniref:tetratricopeptide repeat protein n=1 Tax=Pseudoalteromonas phenolica TaxID=161398 RepID=UPI0014869A53|nr:tetratricopeptide repeat protein [Pseudoalteromonas phenolica]